MMKVARLHASGDVRVQEEPIPIPVPGERLIGVKAVGICGSDLHWFAEAGIGDARLERALVLGHEFAGLTETGELVAVEPAIPCRRCEWCEKGHPNLCPHVRFAGHGEVDGALREWMAWDESCLFPLPESLTEIDGAMLEPLGVAIHAVDLGKLLVGMSVGVYGCGTIGLMIVQLARLSGAAQIIATDIHAHRLDAARSFGANHVLLAENSKESEAILRVTGGRGVDVAFEVAGEQAAVETAFATTIPGGLVVLVGIPADNLTSFPASIARRKGLTIKLVRRMKHTYPRAIALVHKGLVDVRSLVTHRFTLDKVMNAFALAEKRAGIKIIVEI